MTTKVDVNSPEIQKILVCSTAHLTEEECNVILPSCKDELQILEHEFGVLVRVPCEINIPEYTDEMDQLEKRVGAGVMKLMRYAHSLDCWGINFDSDALTLDTKRFPTHDW